MSRSKKQPYFTDQQSGCSKKSKRKATRAVRSLSYDNTPVSGSSFKKVSNSWDIRDWSFFSPTIKKAYRK